MGKENTPDNPLRKTENNASIVFEEDDEPDDWSDVLYRQQEQKLTRSSGTKGSSVLDVRVSRSLT